MNCAKIELRKHLHGRKSEEGREGVESHQTLSEGGGKEGWPGAPSAPEQPRKFQQGPAGTVSVQEPRVSQARWACLTVSAALGYWLGAAHGSVTSCALMALGASQAGPSVH